eukprot:1755305-Amphidinium_carterae.1
MGGQGVTICAVAFPLAKHECHPECRKAACRICRKSTTDKSLHSRQRSQASSKNLWSLTRAVPT